MYSEVPDIMKTGQVFKTLYGYEDNLVGWLSKLLSTTSSQLIVG